MGSLAFAPSAKNGSALLFLMIRLVEKCRSRNKGAANRALEVPPGPPQRNARVACIAAFQHTECFVQQSSDLVEDLFQDNESHNISTHNRSVSSCADTVNTKSVDVRFAAETGNKKVGGSVWFMAMPRQSVPEMREEEARKIEEWSRRASRKK